MTCKEANHLCTRFFLRGRDHKGSVQERTPRITVDSLLCYEKSGGGGGVLSKEAHLALPFDPIWYFLACPCKRSWF
jgi:hypothetical protein